MNLKVILFWVLIAATITFVIVVLGKVLAENDQEHQKKFCSELNAKWIDAPDGYRCVRDGVVVGP